MGKQIRFFTLSKDEEALLEFVLSIPGNKLIASRSKTPGIRIQDQSLLSQSTDPDLRDLLIWPSSLQIQATDIILGKRKVYDEQLMDFHETDEMFYYISDEAPVIQFDRSFIRDDGKLTQGRLWCELYRLVDNQLEYKGGEFEKVFETLSRWIISNFYRKKGIDGYFGSEALDWYRRGGKVFP
jgi:hypothetical protein